MKRLTHLYLAYLLLAATPAALAGEIGLGVNLISNPGA